MGASTVETTAAVAAQRPPETVRVDGRAATQFKPGNPGPRRNRKGEGRGRRKPPRLLADMRRVYEQDESKDRTPGQRTLRKLFKDSPKEFIAQLAGLEKAYLARAAKAGKAAAKEQP